MSPTVRSPQQVNDRQHVQVSRFIDLEARVDGEEDEEDEEDDEVEDFISDNSDSDNDETLSWKTYAFPNEDEDNETSAARLEALADRYRRLVRRGPQPGLQAHLHNTMLLLFKQVRMPSSEDWGLWRVKCRHGVEEEAVFSLLKSAKSQHEIRAAFMRGPERGSIYVEATMNAELQQLLTWTPGIIFRAPRVPITFPIDLNDRAATLKLPTLPVDSLKVGDWARIVKGAYKGDLGLVTVVGEWFRLLVVPRLRPQFMSRDRTRGKRKRSRPTPPPIPILFDPVQFEASRGVKLTKTGAHSYHYRKLFFEHGLLLKDFDYHAISASFVFMPSCLSSLLLESRHPKILEADFPPPQEWEFYEGETIIIIAGLYRGKKGIVSTVEDQYLHIDLSNGEGLVIVSWNEVRKHYVIGDFVQISHGLTKMRSGWVVSVSDETIQCTGELPENPETDHPSSSRLDEFTVHVNCARLTEVPFFYSTKRPKIFDKFAAPVPYQPRELDPSQSRRPASPNPERNPDEWWKSIPVPWKNVSVLLSGELKGRTGRVRDVHFGRKTRSGLEVDVELDTFGTVGRRRLDYDDVRESKTQMKLFEYQLPASTYFYPLNRDSRSMVLGSLRSIPTPSAIDTSGGQTPMPAAGEISSSSPAWDPSSSTPLGAGSTSTPMDVPTVSPSAACIPIPAQPTHVLLDPRLENIKVSAKVTGAGHTDKTMTVWSGVFDGRRRIVHSSNKAPKDLTNAEVVLVAPNPTRTDSLLVVVNGEHIGTFVRRVTNDGYGPDSLAVCRVVIRNQGSRDIVTDTTLKLRKEDLALVKETNEEKELNKGILLAEREAARVRR